MPKRHPKLVYDLIWYLLAAEEAFKDIDTGFNIKNPQAIWNVEKIAEAIRNDHKDFKLLEKECLSKNRR